ncbi:T9SS C-terminal target domain-containing protein [Hymenobacter oligotrophus]|uniref:T9SS C-terminal target domain-containing protein n=1 Tax=Hymenobacter oligotrophus TaxID=2319843 RepID=A0A3B7QZZ2_9BACT|nr:T9SS C-terminal target domain-containing protein [Hymenobacter oligotrophus]
MLVALLASGSSFAQALVDPEIRAALQSNPVAQVIITFKGEGAPQTTQLSLLRQLGLTKGVTFRSLPIVGSLATAAQVQALAERPEIRSIYLNKRLKYYNYDATNLTGVKRLRTDANLIARNNGMPVSGKGIGVVINDSGVDGTHDDIKSGTHLVQNVLGSINLNAVDAMLPVTYLENVPNTDNNSGHGTHCAGTVGGNGAKSGGKYEGVAPGASLIGYGSGAALLVLDGIGGFDYAITHQAQYNIRVISNSWGSSGKFDPEHPINLISKKAYDRGMVALFAAGNEGPGSDTHNPYAIAPWVISVGAGDKYGKLADFSSRGVKNEGGTFAVDGQTWTYQNRPTLVAPGVDIVSTRVIGPVASLGAQMDIEQLEPAHVPFYTHMSGTSMATPHVAGVVALMLEAKPSLSPMQVKQILEKTATNMPNREPWEVGAGYVNAYAAVDHVFRGSVFGAPLNLTRTFNSSVNAQLSATPFSINYNPLIAAANQQTFQVGSGVTSLEAKVTAGGVSGLTGNPINLVLIDPNGTRYTSGISAAFALYQDRGVAVAAPKPGTWTVLLEGLRGVALPENISGTIRMLTTSGTTGLGDIAGHPAEAAIKTAVAARLADGLSGGYKPNELLTRRQLADYLLMGQAVRQYLPTTGTSSFTDVQGTDLLLAESVTGRGAALRDRDHKFRGVMLPTATGIFAPASAVNRTSLAYSLVQSLGLEEAALARNGKPLTIAVDGKYIPVDDAAQIPAGLEGYVSVALELNLINAYYSVTQGPFDLTPTLHAAFKPAQAVTRGEFAVIVTRTFTQWDALTQPAAAARSGAQPAATQPSEAAAAYPNPFSGSTTISYTVAEAGYVTVEVYNVLGRKVRTLVSEAQQPGSHQVKFDASSLTRGSYVFKVKAGSKLTSKQLLVQ